MAIPHVQRGTLIDSNEQNAMIDQINLNSDDIEDLKLAVGDPEAVQALIDEAMDEHVNAETPHPVYDNSFHRFDLIFLNGLV